MAVFVGTGCRFMKKKVWASELRRGTLHTLLIWARSCRAAMLDEVLPCRPLGAQVVSAGAAVTAAAQTLLGSG